MKNPPVEFVPNGFQQATRDTINPVEHVTITNPKPGVKYTIVVEGKQVVTPHPNTGGQPYALVVTGNFKAQSEYYQGRAPAIESASGIRIVAGAKSRIPIAGKNFASRSSDNSAAFSCDGSGSVPVGRVAGGSSTGLVIETNSGWTCATGLKLSIESGRVASSDIPVEVQQGGGLVGADGFTIVAPSNAEDQSQICGALVTQTNCEQLSFCTFDATTGFCTSQPAISLGVVVIIIIIVIAVGIVVYWQMHRSVLKRAASSRYVPRGQPSWLNAGAPGEAQANVGGGKSASGVVAVGSGGGGGSSGAELVAKTEKPLKEGWKAIVDDDTGKTYYFEESTGSVTWERHLVEVED